MKLGISESALSGYGCRSRIPLVCELCGKGFKKPKNEVMATLKGETNRRENSNKFCSVKCASLARSTTQETECRYCLILFKRKGKNVKFCSRTCSTKFNIEAKGSISSCVRCGKYLWVPNHRKSEYGNVCGAKCRKPSVTLTCDWCGDSFQRQPRYVKKGKTAFCSGSCRSFYVNKNLNPNLGKTSQRSKAEAWLESWIRNDFTDLTVVANSRTLLPSGLEIDLAIIEHKVAIEVNGPFHYRSIHGKERLRRIQYKDRVKKAEAQSLGYKVYVIDVSKLTNDKRALKYVKAQYETIIRPALKCAPGGS